MIAQNAAPARRPWAREHGLSRRRTVAMLAWCSALTPQRSRSSLERKSRHVGIRMDGARSRSRNDGLHGRWLLRGDRRTLTSPISSGIRRAPESTEQIGTSRNGGGRVSRRSRSGPCGRLGAGWGRSTRRRSGRSPSRSLEYFGSAPPTPGCGGRRGGDRVVIATARRRVRGAWRLRGTRRRATGSSTPTDRDRPPRIPASVTECRRRGAVAHGSDEKVIDRRLTRQTEPRSLLHRVGCGDPQQGEGVASTLGSRRPAPGAPPRGLSSVRTLQSR